MKPIPTDRLTHEERDRLDREARAVAAIERGLADVEAGRVVDDAELGRILRVRLGDLVD